TGAPFGAGAEFSAAASLEPGPALRHLAQVWNFPQPTAAGAAADRGFAAQDAARRAADTYPRLWAASSRSAPATPACQARPRAALAIARNPRFAGRPGGRAAAAHSENIPAVAS